MLTLFKLKSHFVYIPSGWSKEKGGGEGPSDRQLMNAGKIGLLLSHGILTIS